MSVVLWQIEISHYNEKVRWALDYKGIPHERRTPTPGLHGFVAAGLTRGRNRRLPVVRLDGRTIHDSTAIIAALEEHRPEPPLYPQDPGERTRALALEDRFDEELAPALRRWVWQQTLHDADAVEAAVLRDSGGAQARVLRAMGPLVRPVMRKDYDINPAAADRALATMRAIMDLIESEIGPSGYLVGDRFSVADLTGAALFTPVLCPPERQYAPRTVTPPVVELRAELAARPGGEWVAEMFARHRPVSAEVAA